MTFGTEDKKKLRALAILGVVLAGAIYYSFFSGPSVPSYTPPAAKPAANGPVADTSTLPAGDDSAPRVQNRNAQRAEEFHPVLRSKRKEDRLEPTKIDPRIKLYILAKLQEVPPAGSGRNLFQFGPPPAPKPVEVLPKAEPKIAVIIGPPLIDFTPKPPPPKPPDPPPPPFGPKYYGLATTAANGKKRAFFLDGEDIIIRAEGETVKGHFRVVRIGQTSCVVEDTDNKKQQTIQIAEDVQG